MITFILLALNTSVIIFLGDGKHTNNEASEKYCFFHMQGHASSLQ